MDDVKGVPASDSPADSGEPKETTALPGAEGDEGEKTPEGDLHKSERWKQVYGGLQEYKGLGAVDELRAKLRRLDYYDQLAAEASADAGAVEPEPEALTAEERKAADATKKIRKELEQIAPELAAVSAHDQVFKVFFSAIEAGAMYETERLMEESGLPTADSDKMEMSGMLADVIGRDRKLYFTYIRNPEKAVQLAWDRTVAKFGNPKRAAAAATQKDKEKLTGLPKAHKGGGASGEGAKAPAEPKTIEEAFQRSKERIKSMS